MRSGEPAFAAIQFVGAIGHLGAEFENGSLQAVLGTSEPFMGLVQDRALAFESTLSFLQFQLTPVEFSAAAGDIGGRFRSVLEESGAAGESGPFGGQQRRFERFEFPRQSSSDLRTDAIA